MQSVDHHKSKGVNEMMRRHVTRIWKAISMTLAVLAACGGQNNSTRNRVLTSPILFKYHVEARRQDSSIHRILRPQGDSVSNGDRLQAFVKTSQDVYLYLGYCDRHEFALFPTTGGVVRAEAKREARIPPEHGALEISSDAKSEVIYVILSTEELSLASPDLAVKLATSRGTVDGDCAGLMRDSSGKPIPPETPVNARSSESNIEVVRYEFKHPVSAVADGKARSP